MGETISIFFNYPEELYWYEEALIGMAFIPFVFAFAALLNHIFKKRPIRIVQSVFFWVLAVLLIIWFWMGGVWTGIISFLLFASFFGNLGGVTTRAFTPPYNIFPRSRDSYDSSNDHYESGSSKFDDLERTINDHIKDFEDKFRNS